MVARRAGGLEFLLGQVRAAGVPIALALEHQADPLGVRRTLHGVLELLGAGVPVIQLRCDVSGLGLLCHGALAAALGTRSSLRHIFPKPTTTGGGPPRPAAVATVVKECLSFVAVDRIALAVAVAANPDDSLWMPCTCTACQGRSPEWMSLPPTGPGSCRRPSPTRWKYCSTCATG
jgi:hypothetical protein